MMLCWSALGHAQFEVITYAGSAGGTGTADGTGSNARFTRPVGVAADRFGNVYVVDTADQVVRKLDAYGNVTVLAGLAGQIGSADGIGSAARFSYPWGVAVDANGTLYVCDSSNNTVRKIAPDGTVTTIAGLPGASGSTDGTGSVARFNHPSAIAVDASGNLYITDYNNSTIRKITPAGVVTTLAGSPGEFGWQDGAGSNARFNYPDGIAVGLNGDLFVSDSNNHTIRRITPNGDVSTFAGEPQVSGATNGALRDARFNRPIGIAVARNGDLFVADSLNNTIRRISGGMVTTIAGNAGSDDGVGSGTYFFNPIGLALDPAGTIFVSDTYNSTLRRAFAPGDRLGADFDDDRHPDLIWQGRAGGRTDAWLFGGTHFERAVTIGSMSSEWHLAGAGRFSNDNVSDLLWQNTDTGEVGFRFVSNFTPTYRALGTWGTGWTVAAVGDFNNDGWSDFIWQNKSTGDAVA
jgi:hypothetical protein